MRTMCQNCGKVEWRCRVKLYGQIIRVCKLCADTLDACGLLETFN